MSSAKEMAIRLKRRTKLILRQIIEGEDLSDQINKIDEEILDLNPPGVYYGADGIEVQYIKGFREALMILNQQKVIVSGKKMTGADYYNGIELIKDQAKSRKK